MKYFFDTEFLDTGSSIEPVSIGIVAEDGREYYAEWDNIPWNIANEWVLENVRPHLLGAPYVLRPEVIREQIIGFVGNEPEFWAYYADYDWVLLCQLYGTMMELPRGWPKFCMDIKQHQIMLDVPTLPKQSTTEHNALNDARWNKEAHEYLMRFNDG